MKIGKTNFWYSPTYRIIKAMQATGNGEGLIRQWFGQVGEWAARETGPDAEAVRAWLPLWHHRPFYTAAELAPLFPMLALAMGFTTKAYQPHSPRRMKHELEYGQVPKLVKPDGSTLYRRAGHIDDEYFIVEQQHKWSKVVVSQQEFEYFV